MLQVTEVDCVRHPEELKASHGNYDIGSIMEVRKEKTREMVCVKCLQKHTDRTSQAMVATIFMILFAYSLKCRKLSLRGSGGRSIRRIFHNLGQ